MRYSNRKFFERFHSGYERFFSAGALCIAGLLAMPAMLFNPFPLLRIAQFLFFWFLCWLAGKKNKPLATILVILIIVAFNLIVPYGEVLYSIGRFRITRGALMTGTQRAVTLQGLIMLSRLSIRRDLKIPGGFGELIGASFRFFAKIMDSKHRITRKNLIGDIDQLMIKLSEEEIPETPAELYADRTKGSGFIILAALVILAWLPLLMSLLYFFPH